MEFPQIDKAYELINEKLQVWLEGGIKLLPNIVVAFFIAFAFGLLAKVAGKVLNNVLAHRLLISKVTMLQLNNK